MESGIFLLPLFRIEVIDISVFNTFTFDTVCIFKINFKSV